MQDRRALLIGSWGSSMGPGPSPARVKGLLNRWETLLDPVGGRYKFANLANREAPPHRFENETRGNLINHIEAADVTSETLLFLVYVGHSMPEEANDLRLQLRHDKPSHILLSQLLGDLHSEGVRRLICVLDSCHVGRAPGMPVLANFEHFMMLATGDSYAFATAFSEAMLRTLEARPVRNDFRIDIRHGGFTYQRLFDMTKARMQDENKARQEPRSSGAMGSELLLEAPVRVPDHYKPLVSRRTVYGRIYAVLNLIAPAPIGRLRLLEACRGHADSLFLLNQTYDQHVSEARLEQYFAFLVASGLCEYKDRLYTLTTLGELAAMEGQYNRRILEAIQDNLFPDRLSLDNVDEVILELLDSALPTTPRKIVDALRIRGFRLNLTPELRIALSVLPLTGRFVKGAADALFPSGGDIAD